MSYPYNDVKCKNIEVENGIALSSIAPGLPSQTMVMDPAGSGSAIWKSNSTAFGNTLLVMTAQNYNSGVTVALTFNSFTSNNLTFGPTTFLPFNTAGIGPFSTLTCAISGYYRFFVDIALTNVDQTSSQVSFTLLVDNFAAGNKLYSTVLPAAIAGNNTINGTIYRAINAGQVIKFRADRVVGTGNLSAFASSSNVSIDLVSVVY